MPTQLKIHLYAQRLGVSVVFVPARHGVAMTFDAVNRQRCIKLKFSGLDSFLFGQVEICSTHSHWPWLRPALPPPPPQWDINYLIFPVTYSAGFGLEVLGLIFCYEF